MKKNIIAVIILLAVISGLIFLTFKLTEPKEEKNEIPPPEIGFSLGTVYEERWITDLDIFVKKVNESGIEVSYLSSNYDTDVQIRQIENLVEQGVKIIVVVASDSEKIAPAISKAKEAGVKIIAYDRLIKNSNIDFYVSFDNIKVGQLQAQSIINTVDKGNFAYIGGSPTDNNAFLVKQGSMSVLEPFIRGGMISLVVDKFSNNWDAVEARKNIKTYLDSGRKLDAVIAANDGTASGVVLALQEKKLDGKIPVSGQDADLAACKRIIAGTQTSTVYKPISSLANKAAEVAISIIKEEELQTTTTVNNGKIDVPSLLIEPTLVTKKNMMSTVVEDGFHTYEEIYNTK